MTQEELIEKAVARVLEQVSGDLVLDTLSVEGMLEVGYGLALCPEAKTILEALLQGRRVAVRGKGLESRSLPGAIPPGLGRLLRDGEARLKALGVEILEERQTAPTGRRCLITLARAKELAARGEVLPPGAIVTPSAADFWKEQGGSL